MMEIPVESLTEDITCMISESYNNDQISFYSWMTTSSRMDFQHLYQLNFGEIFIPEIIVILSYNTYCALITFYDFNTDLSTLIQFMNMFIKNQLLFLKK